jgi:hypothetical protein
VEAGSLREQPPMQPVAQAVQLWLVLLLANVVTPVRVAPTVCVSIERKELKVRTNIN